MNPSEIIDKQIAALTDWRGKMLADVRNIIHDADPEIVEELKWMGTPTWSHDGIIVVATVLKDKVKLTFQQGASLPDPGKLFNNGLGGKRWRAIDLSEGDRINERALKDIIRAAVAHNRAGLKGKTPADIRGIRDKVHKKRKTLKKRTVDIMAAAPATLEKKRKELGFSQVGMANGIPIYVSTERANASESEKRVVEAKLGLATHQLLLSGLSSDSSLRGKFNDNGKSDTCFWIAGTGRDTNHLITDSQEAEITDSQEAEIFKLAESGMKYTDIARKLGIPAVGVYYALEKGSKRKKRSKRPRTSILCTFDKEGNLIIGKGDSIETTVRASKGSDDNPLLFFVLRDSYARIGGARFVLAACNGRQFGPDFVARVVVGVPQKPTLAKAKEVKAGQS